MNTRIQRVSPGKYETNDIRPRHEPRPDRPPFRTPRIRSSECVELVTAEVLAKDGSGTRIVAAFGRSQRRCGFDRDPQGLPTCTAGIYPATSINPVDVAAGRSPAMSKTPPYKLGSNLIHRPFGIIRRANRPRHLPQVAQVRHVQTATRVACAVFRLFSAVVYERLKRARHLFGRRPTTRSSNASRALIEERALA